jgi:hypothetical protein
VVKKWVIRGIKSAVIAIVVFGIALITQAPRFSHSRLSEVWNASSGESLPPRAFYAVAYPRTHHVELRNDQGESCGRLGRAVLLSIDEWESAERIGVYVDATTLCTVGHDDLLLELSDREAATEFMLAAKEFYSSTFNPTLHDIKEFAHFWSDQDGVHGVTVFEAGGDVLSIRYRVANGSIQPGRILRYNSKAAGFELFLTSAVAVIAATAAVASYWAILLVRWWWFRPRPPQAAA